MNRTEKIAYLKTITPQQKRAHDNFIAYKRVEKHRNKDP